RAINEARVNDFSALDCVAGRVPGYYLAGCPLSGRHFWNPVVPGNLVHCVMGVHCVIEARCVLAARCEAAVVGRAACDVQVSAPYAWAKKVGLVELLPWMFRCLCLKWKCVRRLSWQNHR